MKFNFSQKTFGFSLLEAIVAIAIISIAIASAFGLAPQAFMVARYSSNEVTASYLAQEGLEIVRNLRDQGWVEDPNGTIDPDGVVWLNNIPPECIGPDALCNMDIGNHTLFFCGSECARLQYRDHPTFGRVYGNGSLFSPSDPESIYRREISIVSIGHPQTDGTSDTEIQARVTMSWNDGRLNREIVIRENLFDWWTIRE